VCDQPRGISHSGALALSKTTNAHAAKTAPPGPSRPNSRFAACTPQMRNGASPTRDPSRQPRETLSAETTLPCLTWFSAANGIRYGEYLAPLKNLAELHSPFVREGAEYNSIAMCSAEFFLRRSSLAKYRCVVRRSACPRSAPQRSIPSDSLGYEVTGRHALTRSRQSDTHAGGSLFGIHVQPHRACDRSAGRTGDRDTAAARGESRRDCDPGLPRRRRDRTRHSCDLFGRRSLRSAPLQSR
jgi:hypothetical protein